MVALRLAGRRVEQNPYNSAIWANDTDLIDESRAIFAEPRAERFALRLLSRGAHACKRIGKFQCFDFFPCLGCREALPLRFVFLRACADAKKRDRKKRRAGATGPEVVASCSHPVIKSGSGPECVLNAAAYTAAGPEAALWRL